MVYSVKDQPSLINTAPLKKLDERTQVIINQLEMTKNQFSERLSPPDLRRINALKDKIEVIKNDAHLELDFCESMSDELFILKSSLKKIDELTHQEWPLLYSQFKQEAVDFRKRLLFVDHMFKEYLNESILTNLTKLSEKIDLTVGNLDQEILLKNNDDNETRLQAIKNLLALLKEHRENLDAHIGLLSMYSTRDKILKRIQIILNTFEELANNRLFSTLHDQVRGVTEPTETELNKYNINEKLDTLKELDIQIEKIYAKMVIQSSYNDLKKIAKELEKKSLNLSSEMRYAEDSVEGTSEFIEGLSSESSVIGMNPLSQLHITREGTLKTFARTIQAMYEKFGECCITKTVELLPFAPQRLKNFDGIRNEELLALQKCKKEIVEKAKEELSWGKNGVPTVCPPLFSESDMQKLIEDQLKEACHTIYKAYAEQCIRKSLKFKLLIKQFDGCNPLQIEKIKNRVELLIKELFRNLDEILTAKWDPLGKNILLGKYQHSSSLEIMVDEIIARYIIKIHELDCETL